MLFETGLILTGIAITKLIIDYFNPDKQMRKVFLNKHVVTEALGGDKSIRLIDKKKENYGYHLAYRLPLGISEEDIERVHRALEIATQSEIEFYELDGLFHFDLYSRELPGLIDYKRDKVKGLLSVPVGVSRRGLEVVYLAQAPHLLVGGETGSGKTNLFRVMADSLLGLSLVDLRIIDVTRKLGYLGNKGAWFAGDYDQISELVYDLSKEMRNRYKYFDEIGVDEIDQAPDIERIVLIIDEFNALSPSLVKWDNEEKKRRASIFNRVVELITRGRGAGIHLIIGIQRPDARIMEDGQIRANMPVRIAFKTVDKVNSSIILDSPAASFLPGNIPGRCILRGKDGIRQIQVYNLPHDRAKAILPTQKRG